MLAPVRAHRIQVICEGVRRAAPVLPHDQGDIPAREGEARIVGADPRVIPRQDATREDVGQNATTELEIAAEPREVVREHDHAGRDWHQLRARLDPGKLVVVRRRIARAEIDGVGQETLFALAAAHDVIGDQEVRIQFSERHDPLLVEWCRERRASPAHDDPGGGGPVRLVSWPWAGTMTIDATKTTATRPDFIRIGRAPFDVGPDCL
jgi:hypothetical protein